MQFFKILAYGQSPYVREFGMQVDDTAPVGLTARVLQPPKLRYGQGSPQPVVVGPFAVIFLVWCVCSQIYLDSTEWRLEHVRPCISRHSVCFTTT